MNRIEIFELEMVSQPAVAYIPHTNTSTARRDILRYISYLSQVDYSIHMHDGIALRTEYNVSQDKRQCLDTLRNREVPLRP